VILWSAAQAAARTICLLAYIYLAVTTATCHAAGTGPASDPGLVPVTVPENSNRPVKQAMIGTANHITAGHL
jgi:hypothetical protein